MKRNHRIPADIQRIASTQTLKVLKGAAPKWKLAKNIFTLLHLGRKSVRRSDSASRNEVGGVEDVIDDETVELSRPDILNISLTNILGKNYKAKQRHRLQPSIKPKIKNLQCVAFSSLPFSELEPIRETKMPSLFTISLEKSNHADVNMRGRLAKKAGKRSPMRNIAHNKVLPLLAFRK